MAKIDFAADEVAKAAKDPAIAAVLAAKEAQGAAAVAQDANAWAEGLSSDLVVNTPGDRVARRDAVIAFFSAGQVSYDSADTTIEFAEARGDLVVLMGEEVVTPMNATLHAGKAVHRRFTDVWRREQDGAWRITIRQATNISVE